MNTENGTCKRVRSRNFSDNETLILINLTVPYISVLENKQTNAATNKEKANAWVKIAEEFNRKKPFSSRGPEQLASKYENLKGKARKYAAAQVQSMYNNDGRSSPVNKDVILEKFLTLINHKLEPSELNTCGNDVEVVVEIMEAATATDSSQIEITPQDEVTTYDIKAKATHTPPKKFASKFTQSKRKRELEMDAIVSARCNFYDKKCKLMEIEMKMKERDLKYKDVQIALLQQELKEKQDGAPTRLAILKQELALKSKTSCETCGVGVRGQWL